MTVKSISALLFPLLCVLTIGTARGQDDYTDITFADRVYVDHINTVTFALDGLPFSLPLLDMNRNVPLVLAFDDMDGDVKDYVYRVVHCNQDWQPSQLMPLEYLDGFEEADIGRPNFSFKTRTPYSRYELAIPNRDMSWKLSGNYLLIVYEDEYDKIPVITRRFMVVDRRVGVQAEITRPSNVSKIQTHQEVDFLVDHEQFDIRTPLQEISATILQNGRWDNALYHVPPKFLRPGRQLLFDYQDRIVFPGLKEYRSLDTRSLRRPVGGIATVEEDYDGGLVVGIVPDLPRTNTAHLNYQDLNGDFIIESRDQFDGLLSGEYADVFFRFKTEEPYYDQDIYVVGDFSDYRAEPQYKMVYNPAINSYVAKIPLKQGFYSYLYASLPSGEPVDEPFPNFSFESTEGNSDDTENSYTILVYYRAFAGRYDQLIGQYQISSTE